MNERLFGTDPEFALYAQMKSVVIDGRTLQIPDVVPPAALAADFGVAMPTNTNGKRVVLDLPNLGVQWIEDGAAVELNVKPAERARELNYRIQTALHHLSAYVTKFDLQVSSTAMLGHFDLKKYWQGRGEEFQDCVRFGCDPDVFPPLYKAMDLEKADNVEIDVSQWNLRYFGGHLHIGNMTNDPDIYLKNQEYAPIILDFFLGTLNAALLRNKAKRIEELERLKFYGHPGRVRYQQYANGATGIEYRPLSNFWTNNLAVTSAFFTAGDVAARIIEGGCSRDFFAEFQHLLPTMYMALLTLDGAQAKQIYDQAMGWAMTEGFLPLSKLESLSSVESLL